MLSFKSRHIQNITLYVYNFIIYLFVYDHCNATLFQINKTHIIRFLHVMS